MIAKYEPGGLALERFLPRGVLGSDILFLWYNSRVKSAGNEPGDHQILKEYWDA